VKLLVIRDYLRSHTDKNHSKNATQIKNYLVFKGINATEKITNKAKGLADIEISPPFFAWISTFGRGAKILGPEPVPEKMREFVEKLSEMYKEG